MGCLRRALLVVSLTLAVLAAPGAPGCLALGSTAGPGPLGAAYWGGHARGIILFIGDGMGSGQRAAARWQAVGQLGLLHMDELPWSGLSQTHSADKAITDSAAGGTALATGVKTNNGMVAVDPTGVPLATILEWARARGWSTGLVSTAELVDATPATFAAHEKDRDNKTEIARQMAAAQVDVLLGGGEDYFLPTTAPGCYPGAGTRTDLRNLISETMTAGYTYVCNAAAFAAVDPATTSRLLGLFAGGNMVRPYSPTLAAMTSKAIDILSRDPDGFFLMVEGGQIDKVAHNNDAAKTITDTVDFDAAVGVGQEYAAQAGNVLLIVAADHETGGMAATIMGTNPCADDGPFPMPDGQQFCVGWTTAEHTAADVPVSAQGPCAEFLQGSYENTHIYDVMRMSMEVRSWLYLPLVLR